jgi:outer membrane lipopolysaccharide assembly protein LptE/RlpB
MRTPPIIIVLACCLVLTTCGYRFQGMGDKAPEGVQRIHIPTVTNATTYANLNNALTNELIRRFSQSRLVDVADVSYADAVLLVHIRSVQIQTAARDRTGNASAARRAILTADAVLKRQTDDLTIWASGEIIGHRSYAVVDDQSTVEANLNHALDYLAVEISDKIYNLIFEDF